MVIEQLDEDIGKLDETLAYMIDNEDNGSLNNVDNPQPTRTVTNLDDLQISYDLDTTIGYMVDDIEDVDLPSREGYSATDRIRKLPSHLRDYVVSYN